MPHIHRRVFCPPALKRVRHHFQAPSGAFFFCAPGARLRMAYAGDEDAGQTTNIELGEFLTRPGNAPEHQALVRLIGTLIEEPAPQDNPPGLQGPHSPTD